MASRSKEIDDDARVRVVGTGKRPSDEDDEIDGDTVLRRRICADGLPADRLPRKQRHILPMQFDHHRLNRRFAMDIGGSLVKIVWLGDCNANDSKCFSENIESPSIAMEESSLLSSSSTDFVPTIRPTASERGSDSIPVPEPHQVSPHLRRIFEQIAEEYPNSAFHFCHFPSSRLELAFQFLESKGLVADVDPDRHEHDAVMITGGGAFKYARLFEEKYNIHVDKSDEMSSLIRGLNFVLQHVPSETFTVDPDTKEKTFLEPSSPDDVVFPYLVVNVGSGISILRVDSETVYERVSGTSVGGGTFFALCRLITDVSTFDEIFELSHVGDNENVDMLVGDIYGSAYENIGLPSKAIACSCGKVVGARKPSTDSYRDLFRKEDIIRSLLFMFANNTAQIAYLNALRFGIRRIYFTGSFIRDHPDTMGKLSFGISFWSNLEMEARFVKHEGYISALGCYLLGSNAFSNASMLEFCTEGETACETETADRHEHAEEK